MNLTQNRPKTKPQTTQHQGFVGSGILLGLCCSLLGTQAAEAASFTFTKIADNQNSLFTGYNSWNGAINDKGTVAFYAGSGFEEAGIFTGDGNQISTIFNQDMLMELYPNPFPPDAPPAYYSIRSLVDINDKDTVAFSGSASFIGGFFSTQGIFISEKNKITTVTEFAPSGRLEGSSLVDLNLNSQNSLTTNIFSAGAFFPPSNTITQYNNIGKNNQSSKTIATGSFDNYQKGGIINTRSISLNNKGTVAFSSIYRDLTAPTPEYRIFLNNGNSLNSVNIDVSLSANIAINDQEQIAFVSSNYPNDLGIYSLKNGTVTNLVNNAQGLFGTFDLLDINNQGNLAFSATLNGGEKGIFIGADPVADKVIGVGDSLFGSTITELSFFGDKGLNNKGQIAFFAALADGTKGIFRADPLSSSPKPVPEPTSILSLLTLGLGSWSVLRRSR